MTNRFDRSCVLTVGLAALLAGCGGGSSDGGSGGGGSPGTGGVTSTGGSPATGGASATGGSTASGGAVGTGGLTGTGGSPSTGGATGTGGASPTGGAGGAGGTKGAAGSKGTGGGTPTGGSGGTATGGTGGKAGMPGSGGASGSTGTGGTTHTGAWKVMMLGDSVTGSTCYPQSTYGALMAGGHTNFQFIGTMTTNQSSCGNGAPASVKDEGHPGYGVTYLPQNSTRGACTKDSGCGSYAELQTWAAEKPDIVLMHYGTNDVWDGIATSTILSAYLAVIAEFRKQNPNVIFFVSKIIKLDPSGCSSCLTNVAALAAALTPSWASSSSTASSPITLIDHYDSSFDPTNSADTSDGVHPTPAGASIMATVTVNAIAASGYF
jgi:lysophospholipase L1-like esterase